MASGTVDVVRMGSNVFVVLVQCPPSRGYQLASSPARRPVTAALSLRYVSFGISYQLSSVA